MNNNAIKYKKFGGIILPIITLFSLIFTMIVSSWGIKKVKADTLLPQYYTVYELRMSNDVYQIVDTNNYILTINYDDVNNHFQLDSFLIVATDNMISGCTSMSFHDKYISCDFDNGIQTQTLEYYIEDYTITLYSSTYLTYLFVPRSQVVYFDEFLTLYTYSVDNPVYPLGQVCRKLTNNETFDLFSSMNLGRSLQELYNAGYNLGFDYGIRNDNGAYSIGFEEGYGKALELENSGGIDSVYNLSSSIFTSARELLNVQLLGSITIGNLLFVPLLLGVLIIFFKMLGGR